jgi:hypothetical protein
MIFHQLIFLISFDISIDEILINRILMNILELPYYILDYTDHSNVFINNSTLIALQLIF